MFTITAEHAIYGVGIILLAYLAYGRMVEIKRLIGHIKKTRKMNKVYEDRMKAVEEMKAKGEHHEWIQMAISHPTEGPINTHVCKKTGYAPHIESFISMDHVKRVVQARKDEEEFQAFKEKKLEEYALKYGIGEVEEVYEKMITIKRDFKLKKMEDFKNEIKEKFGDSVKIISDVSELDDFFKDMKK